MFCSRCGVQAATGAQFCHSCGAALVTLPATGAAPRPEAPSVGAPPDSATAPGGARPHLSDLVAAGRLHFHGHGSDIFSGAGLKMVLWFISFLGIPVGVMYAARWTVGNVSLPDGRRLTFNGATRSLYRYFGAFFGLSLLNQACSTGLALFSEDSPILVGVASVALLIGFYSAYGWVLWFSYRWFCSSLSVHGSATRVVFTGSPRAVIGWVLLQIVSLLSVIGWAWVQVAYTRWLLRHVRAPRRSLVFHGSGFAMLWRTLAVVVGSIALLPLPWLVAWSYRWVIGNIESVPMDATA